MFKIIPFVCLVSLITVISQIFLKKGLIKTGGIEINNFAEFTKSFLRLTQEKYILGGIFFAIMAALAWLIIISKKELTLVFPISGGIFYIFLFLFSWLFLGENITIWKITGTIIILIGISIFFK